MLRRSTSNARRTGVGFAYGDTVTVIRPSPRDRFGDQPGDTRHEVAGCFVDYASSTEDGGLSSGMGESRSETVTSTVTVFMPTGSDVTNHDTLMLVDGSRWRVNGRPKRFVHPVTGWTPSVEVTATQITTNTVGGPHAEAHPDDPTTGD